MKRILLPLLAFLSVCLWAMESNVSLEFQPSQIQVNSFKATSLDPAAPWQQPSLTTLLIKNDGNQDFRIQMKVELLWSGVPEPLISAEFISNQALPAGGEFPPLSNRDLVTSQSSIYFTRVGNSNFSLEQLSRRSPILRDAVKAGFFPEGVFSIRVFVKPQSGDDGWSRYVSDRFDIRIENNDLITLLSPGVPAPANPIAVDENPVTFLWHNLDTDFNRYVLTILEFPENLPPRPQSLANTGIRFFQTEVEGGQFSEFLPLKPGNYYAWQIWTRHYSEFEPSGSGYWREQDSNGVSSGWNLFQYTAASSDEDASQRMITKLRKLGDPDLEELFIQGFKPTGEVIWQGRSHSGQSASELLDMISGKRYRITVWE